MKKAAVLLAGLGLILSVSALEARADDLNYAVQVALRGPSAQDLDILGHDWNMKQASVVRRGGVTLITGQISHRIRFSRDDQVYYQVIKRGDVVESIQIKVGARNNFEILNKFSAPVAAAISLYIGVPVPVGAVGAVFGSLNQVATEGWRDAAALIVSAVAFTAR